MADRFDKFTEPARRALTLAQEEALRLKHNFIGSGHLLLGLLRENDGVASRALAELGVKLDQARSGVEFMIGRGSRAIAEDVGLTTGAKKAIELAVDEARLLQHDHIGTEHLLLGLIRHGEGTAVRVLESLGVSPHRARKQVLQLLSILVEQATIIDGKAIAAEVRAEAKERADRLHERGITPGLALVLVGENPSSLSYVRSKGDAAEQAGIYSDMFQFAENTKQQTLLSRILDLNEDGRFHGILVQLPLPKHLDENAIINAPSSTPSTPRRTPTA